MADLRIFGKTPKGTEELAARSGALSMAQRRLLILVDGVRDAEQLAAIVPSAFEESLALLEAGGYIVPVGQSARRADTAPTPSMSIPESEMTTVHEARQRAAQEVRTLLGPSAEALAQTMEAAISGDTLRPLVREAERLVAGAHGEAEAQAFIIRIRRR
jgi:hypothetical protein